MGTAPTYSFVRNRELYLTLRLGFLQIRYLPRALGYLFARGANKGKGDVSSFAALCYRISGSQLVQGISWV